MSELIPHTHPDDLRRQAKDLLKKAKAGDPDSLARMHAVSGRVILAHAQLALAREYGFSSWARLILEVERRRAIDSCDAAALRDLLSAHPELAIEPMHGWCDGGRTPPLNHVALLRFDTTEGRWRDVSGTAAIASELLRAGAPVDGDPEYPETPLMTAASYGDADVARVLVDAGASLTMTAAPTAGGVPEGSALRHAAVFGMNDVADVLVAAGAVDIVHAAAHGSIDAQLLASATETDRIAALRIAAERGHVAMMQQLLDAGTPLDGTDRDGSTALHAAAYHGNSVGVQFLLDSGADPQRRDKRFDSTPLGWSRAGRRDEVGRPDGHDDVEAILIPIDS